MNILFYLLLRHSKNNRNKTALIDSSNTITYSDLTRAVFHFHLQIKDLNELSTGSVVGCIFDDSIDSVICFLGLIEMGLIPCYLNPDLPKTSYAFFLSNCNSKCVVVSNKYYDDFHSTLSELQIQHYTFQYTKSKCQLPLEITNSNLKKTGENIFCCYTSGTSGCPSAILHRALDVIFMMENYGDEILQVQSKDILFTTCKLYFAYGLNNLLFSLYNGATAILAPSFSNPESIFSIFEKYKPSIFFSVPSVYQKLILHANNTIDILPQSLRLCISAGESLSEKISKKWKEIFKIDIIDGIGSTETLSTFISNRSGHVKPGSTGQLVKGFEGQIFSDSGEHILDGTPGILWIKGKSYPTSYLNNPRATKERFKDDWFITNDIFSIDKEGFFFYHGRFNDLIYKQGIWLFPQRIEEKINNHPLVEESAIIDYKNNFDEINLFAFLVISKEPMSHRILCHEIIKNISSDTYYSQESSINAFCLISQLPKTSSGKLQRYKLKESIYYQELSTILEKGKHNEPLILDNRGK